MILTCRSSTVMTYKYMRSPCIFRLPGGGFQPLIVNTFRHCKGYRRTQQKQLLSAGMNSLELQSHPMYMPDSLYLPPSLGSRNRAYKKKNWSQEHSLPRAVCSPLICLSLLPLTPQDTGKNRHPGPLGCTRHGFLAVLVFKWQLLNRNPSGRVWES